MARNGRAGSVSQAARRERTMTGRDVISVALADRSYDIVVGRGAIDELPTRLGLFGAGKVALVTDETVAALHVDRLTGLVEAAGLAATRITVPPGESSKSFARLEGVCDALIDARLDRRDLVLAGGGGVVVPAAFTSR